MKARESASPRGVRQPEGVYAFFSAPVFQDERKTLDAQMLSAVLNALFVPLVGGSILSSWMDVELRRQIPLWVMIALTLVSRVVIRSGFVQTGEVLMVSGLWGILTLTAIVNGGVQAGAYTGYVVMIVIAGLFLSRRAIVFFTVLSIVVGAGLAYAGINGALVVPDTNAIIPVAWLSHAIIFGIVAMLMSISHKIIQNQQTQLRRAKEEAEAANRAKTAFLMTMTHELRTPLNAVIGYSDMLIEEAKEENRKENLSELGKIRTAGKHLSEIIQDILDMSSLESSCVEITLEQVEIQELIRELEREMQPLLTQSRNQLKVEIDEKTGALQTDRLRFRQALWNVLHNANKFTKEGHISLKASPQAMGDHDWLQITVQDTGIGIPPDHLSLLFKPFVQADSSSTRKYGGSGLGLAISQGLCRLLGGNITVSSQPGSGSTFTFRFPYNSH